MARKSKLSLQIFAKDKPYRQHRPCSICILPEASQINDARNQGTISHAVIVQWLRDECGYKHMTLAMLQNHFSRKHHVFGADS